MDFLRKSSFAPQEITGGDMGESVVFDDEVALSAFASTRGTKYHNVLHFTLTISMSKTRGE